jgi:uncharacterized protein
VKIGVVGSGVSGLVAARLLSFGHEVVVFEADRRIGGHVNTVTVDDVNGRLPIDTGFIVFNDRTYPNFCKLLEELQVSSIDTSMSFSVRCDKTGLEYNGTSLNGLFANRGNLLNPSFMRMLYDIVRFNRSGARDLEIVPEDQTVAEYLAEKKFSSAFANNYLLPMGAAIWSCPFSSFQQFPIRFILEFYCNHGLLSLTDRPQWKVIKGGSREYVERLVAPFRNCIRTDHPVVSVRRYFDSVEVIHSQGVEHFDEVIFACHSDQALRMLQQPHLVEQQILRAFPYSSSSAVLHTDENVLPRNRRAWASWNYHVSTNPSSRPTLTYNMNILQRIESPKTYCVTLNEDSAIDSGKVIASFKYAHPVFTVERARMQRRHHELIRRNRISYCGAYWRNGFHEDGVVSALAVCRAFGIDKWSLRPVSDLSTKRQLSSASESKS